jgi:hypothetical protein
MSKVRKENVKRKEDLKNEKRKEWERRWCEEYTNEYK